MKIAAVQRPFFSHPKSYAPTNKKSSMSVPKFQGADIFCFKGNQKQNSSIIPSSNPTDLEANIEEKQELFRQKQPLKNLKTVKLM